MQAAHWLLEAQRAAGGGYAHSFHLLHGWRPAYPETTGYILPTLLRLAAWGEDMRLRESVERAHAWLLTIQRSDGSFCDLDGRPQAFDTGQVLIGFNYLAEHQPGLADREACRRAAYWLASAQESDGSFLRHAYRGRPHAYYARVGAALASAGRILSDDYLRIAGIKNLTWCLAQQEENGFFRHLSFDAEPPYLHTMIYVIEGLLDGHVETGDVALRAAALGFASRLLECARTRDGILRSQYRSDFSVANREYCLVGLAQWAGVCFRFAATGETDFAAEGTRTLRFLKRKQLLSGNPRLNGGLFGSAPLWGRYMRAAIPNWGLKFFIDAILEQHARRLAQA